MQPLLTLLATRPQLLVEHAQAYAALVHEEFGHSFTSWRRRAMWLAVALCCLSVGAVLGGVAAMLWAVTPALLIHDQWLLLAIPTLPLLMAIVCIWMAVHQSPPDAFGNLGRQVSADMAMLSAADWP